MNFKLKWVKCYKKWGSAFNNWKISMSVWINEEEFGMGSSETGSVAGTQKRREIFWAHVALYSKLMLLVLNFVRIEALALNQLFSSARLSNK